MADTLTITDNRTGKTYAVPVADGTIKATDLRQIKTGPEDFGLMTYDPAFMNTAACKSRITFIDGDIGILNYRGYPIDELAEKSSFLETSYLLLHGELPTQAQLDDWVQAIHTHLGLPAGFEALIGGFPVGSHTMGMYVAASAALSVFLPQAKNIGDKNARLTEIHRSIALAATLAAACYRRSAGLPPIAPDPSLSFAGNFLWMMFGKTPNPVLEHALDILFILHADHEQNCSTSTMRLVGSSHADPYAALGAAAAALYGPLHGGANEAVLVMLDEIGDIAHIPEYIRRVKAGEVKLMGFGHRVYKNYDPRAKIIKRTADLVFESTGRNPKIEIAKELERIALEDEYFVKRKLYPNVDFYSGIIYEAMGFPTHFFTVLFAIGRTPGWMSQWEEMLCDSDQKIGRPRQIFLGHGRREYSPIAGR